jgi:hypothetical protein
MKLPPPVGLLPELATGINFPIQVIFLFQVI